MINTLSVATQGLIKNSNSLSIAILGWLNTGVSNFIEDIEFVWSLNKNNINWTVNMQQTSWNVRHQRENWTISYEVEDE